MIAEHQPSKMNRSNNNFNFIKLNLIILNQDKNLLWVPWKCMVKCYSTLSVVKGLL